MTRSTVNVLLTIAAAISGVPAYFLIGAITEHSIISLRSDVLWPTLAGMITSGLIAGCWWVIWRRVVVWTRRRALLSGSAFLGVWLLAGFVTWYGRSVIGREEVEMFMPLMGVAGSLAALAALWCETPEELRKRAMARTVPCPVCGYNLQGLKQTSCPECGAGFTVDELVRGRRNGTDQ